jgi:hypothetical protein
MVLEERKENRTIKRVEIERLSVTSSKPFEVVVAALKAAVGHLDMVEFVKTTQRAQTFAELERVVQRGLGRTVLMMFMELDYGAILRKETGLDTPESMRFVIGNPLIMKEMAKPVPDAGSYAPGSLGSCRHQRICEGTLRNPFRPCRCGEFKPCAVDHLS